MLLGVVIFALLVMLPGAWVTFSLPLKGTPFWARLLIGVILAPVVVSVQFYLIRLAGAPFGMTTILLVVANLPVIYLIYRQRSRLPMPDRSAALMAGIVLLVILSYAVPFLLDPQKRLYTWETWAQADVVYSIANGHLLLEDAELAGVRLSYPWLGHVYQAVLSYLADTPPATSYIWVNLIWLLCMFGLAAGIVAQLGGGPLSQIAVVVWLSFGVNFVGATFGPMVPGSWVNTYAFLGNIWGDNRYTPWLDKVLFFGQMYFAMGFFIAIVYLMIRPWPDGYTRYYYALIGLLLGGIGLIYPVLLPPAGAVVGARAIILSLDCWRERSPAYYKEIIGLGLVIVLAGVLAYANTKLLTTGRAGASLLHLNSFQFMSWRTVETVVVTSPLLIGLGLVLPGLWKERRGALIILGSGAMVSFILYILFDIPWWRNEYKFIFTAAICLAPFASLATHRILGSIGRWQVLGLAILTLVLAAPYAGAVYKYGGALTKEGPAVDLQGFDLRLADQEPHSGLIAAIREKTPIDSLIVLEYSGLYFPTLTQRQLYVAPSNSEPHPGILITSDEMLTLVKGYPQQIVTERRSIVQGLFNSDDKEQMAQSLNEILQFNRPLALVLDRQAQATLLTWFMAEGIGGPIYQGDAMAVWLIEPGGGKQ